MKRKKGICRGDKRVVRGGIKGGMKIGGKYKIKRPVTKVYNTETQVHSPRKDWIQKSMSTTYTTDGGLKITTIEYITPTGYEIREEYYNGVLTNTNISFNPTPRMYYSVGTADPVYYTGGSTSATTVGYPFVDTRTVGK